MDHSDGCTETHGALEQCQVPQTLIIGEVHIITDPKTGAMSVQAPPNLVVALGLLEMAKTLIVENHKRNLAANPPPERIVKAGAEALARLRS